MFTQSLETVRRAVGAINALDVETFVAELDTDVELHSLRAQLEGSFYRGHDGARRMFVDLHEDWEYVRIEIEELRHADDEIVALGHLQFRGRAGGIAIEMPVGLLWRLRGAKLVYVKVFSGPLEALRAAGLE